METDSISSPVSFANHSTSWTPSDSMTPISTNPSRKRSRDETAFEAADAENSYFSFPSAQDVNPPEPIPEEPVYGEGMVLLNPQTGRALAAETQTGTWYEEKVEQEEITRANQPPPSVESRPKMPTGRKSVRLSQSSIRAALEPLTPNNAPASPPKSTPNGEIDEATIALGIGWTKMSSEDPDLQAAARGWARYLEVHYPGHIHGAEILLKNRTLDAYLVGCQEGFFLFAEDLLRGQLVGRTWENCLNNLRSQPIRFDSTEVLQAERTPGPDIEGMRKEVPCDWNNSGGLSDQPLLNSVVSGASIMSGALPAVGDGGGMDID